MGCKKSGNSSERISFVSSRRSQTNLYNSIQQFSILIIYCFILFSCLNDFLSERQKTQAVAFAFVPGPTTKQTTTAKKGSIQKRQHYLKATTTISELASSFQGQNEPNTNNSNESGDDPLNWRANLPRDAYASPLLWETRADWKAFLKQFQSSDNDETTSDNTIVGDQLWEQVKLEALTQLSTEPEAGPQLYQSILSQGSLVESIVSIIANEVQSDLVTATEIKQLFLDMLTDEDEQSIRCDVIAAATRSPSVELAVLAILFHTGLHTLVCYRVGHRLWKADRRGLAKYLQSTVSGHYSADIHPACTMGQGIYLCTAAGVVIGETATVGNDVSILHGVTLGGTGKESGNRHPKVQHGVILKDCSTVLGNIAVGTGAVVMAKAIVNKPVPPLAIMGGVPAKIVETRTLSREAFCDDLEEHLAFKYLDEWKELQRKEQEESSVADTAIQTPKR